MSEAFAVLRKRRWVLLLLTILGIIYGMYGILTQPVRYGASGRIQVGSGASNAYKELGASAIGQTQNLNNELLILHSQSLMLTVAREMDLANNSAFLGEPAPSTRANIDDPVVREKVVGKLLSTVETSLITGTQVLSISATSPNAKLSADLVNHVMDAYIQRSFQVRFASTDRVSRWLSNQLDDLKTQVQTSQEQLIDMQRKLGVLGLSVDAARPASTESTAKVDALSTAESTARVNRIIAESRYRTLQNVDPNNLEGLIDSTANDVTLNSLRGQVASAKALVAEESVRGGLGPNNPKYKADVAHLEELQRETELEQNRLLGQARDTYLAAKNNEEQTAAALDEAKNEAYTMRDSLVEYTLRKREYETNRALYDSLLARLRGAGVQAGLESLEIDIVDRAQRPVQPRMKSKSAILVQGAIFGLLAGIIISFLLESLDNGLRSIAEVESVLQLPSLAVIPKVRRATGESGAKLSIAQQNVQVLATPKSQFSEAFRSLRTSLLLSRTGHPPQIITVTSATPAEGKTTCSTNLACIFAQGETRVLLIDSDLRRPNVHHRFGLNGRVGLSTVLAGSTTFNEAIQHIPELPNLDILCCGPVPPFPTEMLSSDVMRDLLQDLRQRYTYIIVDSAPILSVSDSVILSRQSDALALVVRHGKISRHVVRRAGDLLARANAPLTGVVLNAVDMNSPDYYGYYGYSGYSGYSSSNTDAEAWEAEDHGTTARGGKA